jgi:hypothetical protein
MKHASAPAAPPQLRIIVDHMGGDIHKHRANCRSAPAQTVPQLTFKTCTACPSRNQEHQHMRTQIVLLYPLTASPVSPTDCIPSVSTH